MRSQRSQGSGYSCGYTASWVTEVFYGLSKQFVRYRLGDLGNESTPNTKAGYIEASGQGIIDLFTRYAAFEDRVVFHLVHSPPIDHVMVVEQLPSQAGYRVYQSYNSAHDLAAWLSPRSGNLSKMYDHGDIMSNPKWAPLFTATIQSLFGPSFNLDNYMYLPDEASPLVPLVKAFISYFQSCNTKASVLANFRKAKEQYGEGNVISRSTFFGAYLPRLAAMSAFFKEAWGTSTPIPQNISNYWIDLYGAPNLLLFGGAPFNLVPNMIGSTVSQYYLQAYPVVVPDDSQCIVNCNLLAWSLLAPGRREATVPGLEGTLVAPQHSSTLRYAAHAWAGIAAAAAIPVGILLVSLLKYRQHSDKEKAIPVEIELELTTVGSNTCP